MKYSISLVLLLVSIMVNAQWPNFNRAHPISCQSPPFNYGPSGDFEAVIPIDHENDWWDGYLCLAWGALESPNLVSNYSRICSARLNTNGELLWWNRYDGDGEDRKSMWCSSVYGLTWPYERCRYCIVNNNVVVAPCIEEDITDTIDVSNNYLYKIDHSGSLLEKILIDESIANYGLTDVLYNSVDSSYVITGWLQDSISIVNGGDPSEALLMKVSASGNRVWTRVYDDAFLGSKVTKAKDGGYWVSGKYYRVVECSDGPYTDQQQVLIKTDAFGIEESRITFGGWGVDSDAMVYEKEEDKVVIFGRCLIYDVCNLEYPYLTGDYWIQEAEQLSNDSVVFSGEAHKYLRANDGQFANFHKYENGYALTGRALLGQDQGGDAPNFRRYMGIILRVNENYDSLWCKTYSYYTNGLDSVDGFYAARHALLNSSMTVDGGIVCSGYAYQGSSDPNPGLFTPWVFKVDSLGCLEPGCQGVNVEEIVVGLQNTMKLYPNPARDVAYIKFDLPPGFREMNTSLVVIDVQGKEVMRQSLSPTAFLSSVELPVGHLSTGMYTVHWVNGSAWLDSVKLVKE